MELGSFHDDEDSLAELNITPLVDVALVLLIIFMITAPMLMQGANVTLPQTQPMNKLPSGTVHIAVTSDGEIFLNDDPEALEPDVLQERLVPLADLDQAVYIQGDTEALYGRVVAVLAAVHGAGITNVNIVTTPDPNR